MEIKEKSLRRDEWPSEEYKDVLIEECKINHRRGMIAFIMWKKGIDMVKVSNDTLLIVDEGYTWLEIALENERYAITAMYDKDDHFIEAYFDLTKKNHLSYPDPKIYDMFIDIIISKNGDVRILDENELDLAYQDGTVTELEYQEILKTKDELYKYICLHRDEILRYLATKQRYYKEICYNKKH